METLTLPHNLDAERAVLGVSLVNPDAFYGARFLREEDFFRAAHRKIWAAICALIDTGVAVDTLTLVDALGADLEEAGGRAYVTGLTEFPRSTNVEYYAGIVRKKARRRALFHAAQAMRAAALGDDEDDDAILDQAQQTLLALTDTGERRGLRPASELVAKVSPLIEQLLERKTPVLGLSTGFVDLDRTTRGLRPSDLVVVAGRPSMGKTSLITNIAEHVAEQGQPVALFSLEMSEDDITVRILAARARLNYHHLMSGVISTRGYEKLSNAMADLSQFPLHVDDNGEPTLLEIRAAARRMKAQHGLSMVVIDHMQLMPTPKAENRNVQLGLLSGGFKKMAKELEVPVVLLCQLSRGPEHRSDNRPKLSDLRESGAIEQDADMVWLIFRGEYYQATEENRGKAEIIVAKNRNGPTGTVEMAWNGAEMRFADLAPEPEPDQRLWR
jgi:replicative DNA helicase